jgi:hypothetical protein
MEGLKYVRGAITFEGFIPKDEALEEKLQDVQYYLEVTHLGHICTCESAGEGGRDGRRCMDDTIERRK